jgi:hypothetical protein
MMDTMHRKKSSAQGRSQKYLVQQNKGKPSIPTDISYSIMNFVRYYKSIFFKYYKVVSAINDFAFRNKMVSRHLQERLTPLLYFF